MGIKWYDISVKEVIENTQKSAQSRPYRFCVAPMMDRNDYQCGAGV
jgi:hypothetical protein